MRVSTTSGIAVAEGVGVNVGSGVSVGTGVCVGSGVSVGAGVSVGNGVGVAVSTSVGAVVGAEVGNGLVVGCGRPPHPVTIANNRIATPSLAFCIIPPPNLQSRRIILLRCRIPRVPVQIVHRAGQQHKSRDPIRPRVNEKDAPNGAAVD
jgi:hypothetical protein